MKILIVTQPKETGLTYHRQTVPHRHLLRNYEGYAVDHTTQIEAVTSEQLKEYQIVTFLRIVTEKDSTLEILNKCKDAGCKTVIDIDDYWHLPVTHELHNAYKENKIPDKTVLGLKNCDWVTTTTEYFADKIKEFNKNVTVLPNSIDPVEVQYHNEPTYSDRVRFGWIGGSFHKNDLRLLYEGALDVWRTIRPDRFQLCLGGFNVGDIEKSVSDILKQKNIPAPLLEYFREIQRRIEIGIKPKFSDVYSPKFGNVPSYVDIEFVMTHGYAFPKDKEYQNYLALYSQEGNEQTTGQPYRRLWGKDVTEYATLYNEIDVALIPLDPVTKFVGCKSPIKIVEAGWFKKACIVSNTLPYSVDLTTENSIAINPSKRNDGWGVAMKTLIRNPNRIKDLGEAMHELVREKYMMDTVNKTRDQLYKRITE